MCPIAFSALPVTAFADYAVVLGSYVQRVVAVREMAQLPKQQSAFMGVIQRDQTQNFDCLQGLLSDVGTQLFCTASVCVDNRLYTAAWHSENRCAR